MKIKKIKKNKMIELIGFYVKQGLNKAEIVRLTGLSRQQVQFYIKKFSPIELQEKAKKVAESRNIIN